MTKFRLASAILVVCSAAFGQSDRGTITGTVSDQAGALIPGAKVVANNTATGVQFSHRNNTDRQLHHSVGSVRQLRRVRRSAGVPQIPADRCHGASGADRAYRTS